MLKLLKSGKYYLKDLENIVGKSDPFGIGLSYRRLLQIWKGYKNHRIDALLSLNLKGREAKVKEEELLEKIGRGNLLLLKQKIRYGEIWS